MSTEAPEKPWRFGTKLMENLKLKINWTKTGPALLIPVKDITHPSILQFVLQHEKERLMWSAAFPKTIKVSPEGQNVDINIQDTNLKTVVDVKKIITKEMLQALQHFDYLKIKKTSAMFTGFEQYLKTSEIGIQLMQRGDIKVYFENNAVIIVGLAKDIDVLKSNSLLSITKHDFQVEFEWGILLDLQIEAILEKKGVDVDIRAFGNHITVVGTDENIQKAKEFIAEFQRRIFKKEVNFSNLSCHKLLTDENGLVNENVQGHFMQKLKAAKCDFHLELIEKDKIMAVVVYSGDVEAGNKAAKIVAECIVPMEITLPMTNKLKEEIQLQKRRKKLVEVEQTQKSIKLVCTSDAHESLLKMHEVEDSEIFQVPLIILQFVEKHIKEDVSVEASKCKVRYEIDSNNCELKLYGDQNDIQKFKKGFKELYKGQCVWEYDSPYTVVTHKLALNQIADENKCCFLSTYDSKATVDSLPNSKSVVTWTRIGSSTKITLVSGFMEDADVGQKIMLVSENLFPIHVFRSSNDKLLEPSKSGQKLPLGEIKELVVGESNIVSISYMTTHPLTIVEKNELRKLIEKVLKKKEGTRTRTVGIPVSFLDQNIKLTNVLEPALEAVFKSGSWALYFFCAKDEDLEEVVNQIEGVIAKQRERGFCRTLQSDVKRFTKGFHKIRIETKLGSLDEAKTDVIVNTVHEKLNLSKGMLSDMILKKAGSRIQEECKSKYQQGIKRGQIAITGAGELEVKNGVKKIFHCALEYFEKTKFTQNIKQMVKQCLRHLDFFGYSEIAFPAFGTGNLEYPVRESAKAMFDAVEEYQYECINSGITSVFFVIYEKDENSCDAFLHEENVHKKMTQPEIFAPSSQEPLAKPSLVSTVGDNHFQVNMLVLAENDLKQLPSNVLDVKFVKLTTVQEAKLKKASKNVEMKRDILEIFIPNDDLPSLKSAISSVLECQRNVADISICVFKESPASPVAQINAIWDTVFVAATNEKTSRLRNVYIGVMDKENLESLEKELNNTKALMSSVRRYAQSVKFLSGICGQQKWKKAQQNSKYVKMQVVGKTEESAVKTRREIEAYLCGIENDGKAAQGQFLQSMTGNRVSAEYEENDELKDSQEATISAEVNQGIITFLKAKGQLNTWETYVKETYHLKTSSTSPANLTVEGSLSSILEFEKFLKEQFPDSDENEDLERIEANKKYMFGQKSNETNLDDDVNDVMQPKSAKAQSKESINSSNRLHGKTQNNESDIILRGADGKACTEIRCFNIGEFIIHLLEGDITKMNVDCIIDPCRENLDFVDLSGKIANVAGEIYRKECKQTVKDHGNLKSGECRLTGAGELPCKNVIHVVSPEWTVGKKQEQYERLSEMEKTFKCLLEEVNHLGFSSVALPILGTGVKRFPVSFWAQQLLRALRSFTYSEHGTTDIYVVDINMEKLKSLETEMNANLANDKTHKDLFVSSADKTASVTLPSKKYTYSKTNVSVDIYVVHGKIEDISIEAIVCPEDPLFLEKGAIAKVLRKLGGTQYNNDLTELKQKKNKRVVSSVEAMKVRSPGLFCKHILYTVVPRRNLAHCQSAGLLEREISTSVDNVLKTAQNLHCQGVALPLFGISEDEKAIHTPLETCCREMIKSILNFLETHSDTTIKRIDLVSTETVVVKAFNIAIEDHI